MYTSASEVCIFSDIFIRDASTWDKVRSTSLNFCWLMVPARKAHLG